MVKKYCRKVYPSVQGARTSQTTDTIAVPLAEHNDSKGDSRRLWRTMSGIMGENQTSSDSGGFTADEFASFFVDKVEAVRQATSSTPLHHVSETAAHNMASWEPVTPDDIVKLTSNALDKSCQLDAAPTWLVKQYRGLL